MSLHLVTGYAGREHVTSADHGSFNIAFVGAGEYVFDRGQKFAASIIDNNTVDVADGDIMMQGRHIRQIENHVTRLTFENGERGFYRNDLIVAEYRKDPETFVESATLKVLKGTQTDNAENVTDPEHTHADITEATGARLSQMPLYRVKFTGFEITAVERLFEYLPSVQHVLDSMWDDIREIPTQAKEYFESEKSRFTSEINAAEAQFLEDLNNTEVSNRQAFQTWFDTIKGILDEDAAGHLQNEIDGLNSSKANKTDITNISITGTTNNTGSNILAGTLFYLNGKLFRATNDIPNGSTVVIEGNCSSWTTFIEMGLMFSKTDNLTVTNNSSTLDDCTSLASVWQAVKWNYHNGYGKICVSGIGSLDNTSVKNVIPNPPGFGNYTAIRCKFEASENIIAIYATGERVGKLAKCYLFNDRTDYYLTDWQVLK